MYKILTLIIFINVFCFSQEKKEITGQVTFRSSQNVYVKFYNTSGIKTGDTLFIKDKGVNKPAIVVKFLSSKSAAGEELQGITLKQDDFITALIETVKEDNAAVSNDSAKIPAVTEEIKVKQDRTQFLPVRKNYYGKFSVQSFSGMSNFNGGGDDQRWRYSFSLNADEISGTDFSFSNYFIFSYRNGDFSNIKSDVSRYLKIYDLALKYKIDETSELWAGRHLNRRITNISSIDGIQYEKNFSSFYAGAVAGARPDFNDMSFNFKLFQYGAFIGRTDTINNGAIENTVAFMQQTNNFKTDRRFLYLQHTNDILPKLNLFLSSEVDLFEKIKSESKSTFSLTGLFLSARYTPIKEASFSLSYDARKDVIYYETFRSVADSIIERETRQGMRGGVNLRLFDQLFISLNAGYRFQNSDVKKSSNFNGYISYANIPVIDVVPSVSFTKLQGSYLDGTLWGIRLNRNLFEIADLGIEYRNSLYKFTSESLRQNIITADLSVRIAKFLYLTTSYEGTFEASRTWGRVLFDLTTRF